MRAGVGLLQGGGDLLQGQVHRLRHVEVNEEEGDNAHQEVERKDSRESEDTDHVQKSDRDQDVDGPVDRLAQAHGLGLGVEGKELSQEDPGDWAKTEGVCSDVGDQGCEGQVTDGGGEGGGGAGTRAGGVDQL